MTEAEREEPDHTWREGLEYTVAQLRHLYAHLVNGSFTDPRELAEELLGPQIERLEEFLRR